MNISIITSILMIVLCIAFVQAADVSTHESGSIQDEQDRKSSMSSDTTGTTITSDDQNPDYDALFPNDTVQRLDIRIAPEDWQKMLDDMSSNYGEFGNNSMMQRGGPGQGNPGGPDMGGHEPMNNPGGPEINADDSENPVVVPATVTVNGTTLEKVGIRFKGASSLSGSWREGSYKISMKLDCDEYEDEYPELKNQRLFGFDKLTLKSGFGDSSLIRDKVVPDIFRSAGVPAPRTAFYRVYVDTGSGPVYFGVYTLIEEIGDTVITSQFADGSGNLYKAEDMRSTTFANGSFNVSGFDKETNKKKNDTSDLEQLYTTLNSDLRTTDPATWRTNLESILNVDEFITWLAANTIMQNWDTYGMSSHNYFLYHNPEDGRFIWIPWDNNEALVNRSEGMGSSMPGFGKEPGNASMIPPDPGMAGMESPMPPVSWNRSGVNTFPGSPGMGQMGDAGNGHGPMGGQLSISLDEVGDQWPLIRYLMDDPVYHATYVAAVEKFINGAFDPGTVKTLYTHDHDLISQYVIGEDGEQKGYTLLKSPEEFTVSLDSLISHAASRYADGMEYLANETGGSE
ncbi:MAG: CotH kinase family protein [Methanospirillum sp.]|uniref:CotH kinase family protein n=1 Tax=Methanospirillum sp. TaxID=45200 RepID=UPI00237349E7|nr:CotH kinase family protein [Methanospirillum sp.]MDD1727932.1 CotH kinase family protein [Methanospirillum sp.]